MRTTNLVTYPNELEWAALTAMPIATAIGSRRATVAFPAPANPYGPFTFAVYQRVLGSSPQHCDIATTTMDDVQNIYFTVRNLIVGDDYAFYVNVQSEIFGINQDSMYSNNIIAS